MGRFVTIAKAAQLVGVSKRELQREIDTGGLSTVRGMVHVEDLVDAHPHVNIAEADMVTWVAQIKEDSLQHAAEKLDHELSASELRELLVKANTELAYHRNKLASYEATIIELRHSLKELQKRSVEPNKIQSLIAWIDKSLSH